LRENERKETGGQKVRETLVLRLPPKFFQSPLAQSIQYTKVPYCGASSSKPQQGLINSAKWNSELDFSRRSLVMTRKFQGNKEVNRGIRVVQSVKVKGVLFVCLFLFETGSLHVVQTGLIPRLK
jgi:hypothetical protein